MDRFDHALEAAREIYQLAQMLQETHNKRTTSVARAFSKWEGEARVAANEVHNAGEEQYERDYERLTGEEVDRCIRKWAYFVDFWNERTYEQAVQELQQSLDAHYAALAQDDGLLERAWKLFAFGADDVFDFASAGHINLIKDDARPLVPKPRPVEHWSHPSPPHFQVTEPVYVLYERVDVHDPTKGMRDRYVLGDQDKYIPGNPSIHLA